MSSSILLLDNRSSFGCSYNHYLRQVINNDYYNYFLSDGSERFGFGVSTRIQSKMGSLLVSSASFIHQIFRCRSGWWKNNTWNYNSSDSLLSELPFSVSQRSKSPYWNENLKTPKILMAPWMVTKCSECSTAAMSEEADKESSLDDEWAVQKVERKKSLTLSKFLSLRQMCRINEARS